MPSTSTLGQMFDRLNVLKSECNALRVQFDADIQCYTDNTGRVMTKSMLQTKTKNKVQEFVGQLETKVQ